TASSARSSHGSASTRTASSRASAGVTAGHSCGCVTRPTLASPADNASHSAAPVSSASNRVIVRLLTLFQQQPYDHDVPEPGRAAASGLVVTGGWLGGGVGLLGGGGGGSVVPTAALATWLWLSCR